MDVQQKEEIKELENFYAGTIQRIEGGAINKGKIVAVRPDSFVVDVGYKSEGLVSKSEFTDEELQSLKEGDEIDVFVERINEKEQIVSLSRKRAQRIKKWEDIVDAFTNGKDIHGVVTGKTKGGYLFDVEGIKAFLPASHIDVRNVKDKDAYIGQTMAVKVLKLSNPKNYTMPYAEQSVMVVSRRIILEEERNIQKEETKKRIKEGALIKGTVKNITEYGVFVDLGGIDGLLHISDISWRRVSHASDFFKVGDEGEFLVIKYDEANEKVTLGYKQKRPEPWIGADERYSPGMMVKGKVVTITDYGIFLEIEDGLEGLVHISEIDWAPRPKHPSKYLSLNEQTEAVVLSVNCEARKLSLSIKQTKPKPWSLVGEKYAIGDRVSGRIKTITEFGMFVRLPEGVDGLVHISDISWTKHIKHPSELFKKGQKIEAVVLNIDIEKERLALGIKQLTEDPWLEEIPARFQLGQQFSGKVIKKTDFGIFVELQGGIDWVEGLVYQTEIDHSVKADEGDIIDVRIIKMNRDEKKIGLSMKNVKPNEE